jgi:hypothetical protein
VNSSLTLRPSARLCKSQVVRIGWTPAANQAGMFSDEFHMLSSRTVAAQDAHDRFFRSSIVESFGPLGTFPLKSRCDCCSI